MVIMSIYGGLGNQMFQYALGRHLSHRLNTEFKYDYSFNLIRTDFDQSDILSIFDIFNVKGEKATKKEIQRFKSLSNRISIGKLYYYTKRILPGYLKKYNYIYESYFHFNKDILALSNHCYLNGYWQSEKYFKDIEDLIRTDFRIIKPIDRININITKEIEYSESVSIHLRGRDYITREKTAKMHFTCDQAYYDKSINIISNRVKNPHYFIFSDDPEWAKEHIRIPYPCTYVEGNSWNKTSYEDMRLMSLCKHNIIANSSFSWWAAWLNQNSKKNVIAPLKWFNDSKKNTDDLIPSTWIRI